MSRIRLKRGLFRGWIFFAILWVCSFIVLAAWRIYYDPVCYAFDFIIPKDSEKPEVNTFVRDLKERLTGHPICDTYTSTDLLSLEAYAKENAISQVAFAWKEPGGWSTKTKAMMQVLDGNQITAERIIGDARRFVREARYNDEMPCLLLTATIPIIILFIGVGVYWTATGFRGE